MSNAFYLYIRKKHCEMLILKKCLNNLMTKLNFIVHIRNHRYKIDFDSFAQIYK